MTTFNKVTIPIYELDQNGVVKPNPIFHRPWDKLHSRCIEYPFAASQAEGANRLLDVGSVKGDPAWLDWLEGLPIEVHATDYDSPLTPFNRVRFHQADVRDLPIAEGVFDKVLAVSVIEHIGLDSPQVLADQIPDTDRHGDLDAVLELARVLKPGGELIMTFPFGQVDQLILGGEARNYTYQTLQKFNLALEPVQLDYFEYQYRNKMVLCDEYPLDSHSEGLRVQQKLNARPDLNMLTSPADTLPGLVTWRRIPLTDTEARQKNHIDGVLCGVWRKPLDPADSKHYATPAAQQNKKGEILFECKDLSEALKAFQKAVMLDNSFEQAHGNLAVVYWMQGEAELAAESIEKALALNPGNRLSVMNAVDIFTNMQQPGRALDACRAYLQLHPGDEEARQLFGDLEIQQGEG